MAKPKKAHSGEGSFDKVGDTWVWTRQVGKRRFVVKRKNYDDFTREVDRRKKEIAALGVTLPAKEASLEQYVPGWIEAFMAPPKRSQGTYDGYKSQWRNHIRPHLGKIKLGKLTLTRVQSWINDLEAAGTGKRTIQLAHQLLAKSLATAMIEGRIGRNPCIGCVLPRTETKTVHVLSPAESEALLREAFTVPPFSSEPTRLRHLFRFMLSTGLRSGEALGLLRINCDLRKATVHVRTQLDWQSEDDWALKEPKAGSVRSLPLERDALKALRQQFAMLRRERKVVEDFQDNGLVFPSLRGTPAIHRNVQRRLDALLERATWIDEDGQKQTGIPHVGLHELRRTCLTNLANRGLPMHQLKAYAGHTSITTTAKYYIHVSLEAQREAIQALAPAKISNGTKR